MKVQLRQSEVCPCCEQYSVGNCSLMEVALFGAVKFAWCPACGRKVSTPYDPSYKVRWMYYKKRHDIRVLRKRARRLEGSGKFSGAAEALKKAIAIDPNDGDLYFWRARVLTKLGREAEAMGDYVLWLKLKKMVNSVK